MKIANIIRSSSHSEYIAQVLNPPPIGLTRNLFSLGKFLLVGESTIGIIIDTELFNPNSLGFSLQKEQIPTYAPDLLEEVDTLLKIILIGSIPKDQNIPPETLPSGAPVQTISDQKILEFHLSPQNKFQIKYLPHLINHNKNNAPHILKLISKQLSPLLSPEHMMTLQVIQTELNWRA